MAHAVAGCSPPPCRRCRPPGPVHRLGHLRPRVPPGELLPAGGTAALVEAWARAVGTAVGTRRERVGMRWECGGNGWECGGNVAKTGGNAVGTWWEWLGTGRARGGDVVGMVGNAVGTVGNAVGIRWEQLGMRWERLGTGGNEWERWGMWIAPRAQTLPSLAGPRPEQGQRQEQGQRTTMSSLPLASLCRTASSDG